MNRAFVPVALLIVVLLSLLGGTFYTINETEQAIITQFGKPVGGVITTPGLHLKVPFIQTVRRFDKRVLEWDGSTEQIPTLDKRFILLDTTARWRIAEPLRFLQAMGNERSAQSRLDDLLESAARDIVSGHLLIQAVRNFALELPVEYLEERAADSEQQTLVPLPDSPGALEAQPEADIRPSPIEDIAPSERLGRDKLTALMVERARKNLPNLGIELIDVRIKRINYVTEVEQKVYERMISERQRIAARFRSEGDGASAKIQGGKERDLDRIRSEAYRQAQDIIGQGDAEAARIYAEAYSADAEFYTFLQTLETYKQTLQGNANLLLTTDSDFYRYLKEVKFDGAKP